MKNIVKLPSKVKPEQDSGVVAPDTGLERSFSYRLALLSMKLSQGNTRIYAARFGINQLEWRVITVARWHGPVSANTIAKLISMDKGNVARAVASLEGQGMLSRRPNSVDGRVVDLELTRSGQRLFENINPIARDREGRLLSVLSSRQLQELDAILDKLMDQVECLNTEVVAD